MTKQSVLLSRVLELSPNRSPIIKWAATRNELVLNSWLKSLAAKFRIDRLVSLDLTQWHFEVMKIIEKSFSEKRVLVFEWRSGASTIWMARHGFDEISVEHDELRAEAVKLESQELNLPLKSMVKHSISTRSPRAGSRKRGLEGLDLRHYVDEINHYGLFDPMVIEGSARTECLFATKSRLKKIEKSCLIIPTEKDIEMELKET